MAHRLTSIDYVPLLGGFVVPTVLSGRVAPTRRLWPHLVRRQSTAATYRVLGSIRNKYGPRTWARLPFKSLLVLDRAGIDTVLDSPGNFADPWLKTMPLSCFTPSGVIVSRNQPPPTPTTLWSTRRRLNEEALDFGKTHDDADEFATIVDREVELMLANRPRSHVLVWQDFSTLAAKISQQVIFGGGNYCPYFERHVARIVSASNWGIARNGDLRPFFKRLHTQLKASPPGKHLVYRAAEWVGRNGHLERDARPPSQAAFWAFVIKDAIELHTTRTLALIVQAPEVLRLLLREVPVSLRPTAAAIDGLHLLEACVKEQLRLWTPVPVLLRRAVTDCELDGTPIREGQWVILHAGFYHRDTEVFGASAQRFRPEERRMNDTSGSTSVTNSNPPLYVFSRHRQACAGQFVAMFLLKAVLASLLRRGHYALLDGRIDMDAVPAAIDQFGLRFWRRPRA